MTRQLSSIARAARAGVRLCDRARARISTRAKGLTTPGDPIWPFMPPVRGPAGPEDRRHLVLATIPRVIMLALVVLGCVHENIFPGMREPGIGEHGRINFSEQEAPPAATDTAPQPGVPPAAPAAPAQPAQAPGSPAAFFAPPPNAPPREVFSTPGWDQAPAQGGTPPEFTIKVDHWLTNMTTDHWNGKGRPAGTVALRRAGGATYGPWQTEAQFDGQYWLAKPNTWIPAGTYTVIDSDPETWSQNSASGGKGIVRIYGSPADATPQLAGTPSPAATPPR